MDESSKNVAKAIMVLGGGYLLFRVLRPGKRKSFEPGVKEMKAAEPASRKKVSAPTMDKKDAKSNPTAAKAFTALKAYVNAYNAGEPQSTLDDLNKELSNEYGMTVYWRRQDNKLAVKDLTGKDIIVNN